MRRRTSIAFLRKVEHTVTPNKTQSYRRHATFGPYYGESSYCRLLAVADAAATYVAGYKSLRPLVPPPAASANKRLRLT